MNGLSKRFITAYNEIDDMIHEMADLRQQAPFTEAVRTAALHNAGVRRYADDLYAYGRLRNAIVHSARGDTIIAEPHEDVVIAMEQIAAQLKRPVPAREVLGKRSVVCVSSRSPVLDAIRLIAKHRYSNIPVIEHGRVVGILTPKDLVMAFGMKLSGETDLDDWLKTAIVADVPRSARFAVKRSDISSIEVIDLFSDPKLRALILSDTGESSGRVDDIVTSGDLTVLASSVLRSYVPV